MLLGASISGKKKAFITLFLVFASVASALTTISSLPYVAQIAGETYNLSGNLLSASDGVFINASNIILDCNGSTIYGSNTTNAGVVVGYFNSSFIPVANAVVRNCVIVNFVYGAWLNSTNTAFLNVSIKDNNFGSYAFVTALPAYGIYDARTTSDSNFSLTNSSIKNMAGYSGLCNAAFPSPYGQPAYGIYAPNANVSLTNVNITDIQGGTSAVNWPPPACSTFSSTGGAGYGINSSGGWFSNTNISNIYAGGGTYAGAACGACAANKPFKISNSFVGAVSGAGAVGVNESFASNDYSLIDGLVFGSAISPANLWLENVYKVDVKNVLAGAGTIIFGGNTSLSAGCNSTYGTFTNLGQINGGLTVSCNRIEVRVFNELNASQFLGGVSVTVSNETSSTTYSAQNISQINSSTAPQPNTQLLVSLNSSWYTSKYFNTIGPNSQWVFDAFLLPTSDSNAIFVRFHVTTVAGTPLPDASVSVFKYFGSTLTLVNAGKTDGSGVTSFYLDSLTPYTIVGAKTGYSSSTSTITPTSNDYTIMLSGGIGANNYNATFGDLSWSLSPQAVDNATERVNFTVLAQASNLDYYGFNLWSNGSVIYSTNVSSTTGGSAAVDVNFLNKTNATVAMFVKHLLDSGPYYWNLTLTNYNWTAANWSLAGVLRDFRSYGSSSVGDQLIAIMFALLAGSFATVTVGMGAGGIVTFLVLAIFTVVSWVSWWNLLLVGLTLGALFVLYRGV